MLNKKIRKHLITYSLNHLFTRAISLVVVFIFFAIPSHAFEDYVIIGNGKLTDISIENNKLVDVCPLITVMNEKNTLIVKPLEVGSTRFCVLKNNKDICMFNINIEENKTTIDEVEGFDIFALDIQDINNTNNEEDEFELDEPPILRGDL